MAIFNFFGSIFGYVLWPIFYLVQNYGIAIILELYLPFVPPFDEGTTTVALIQEVRHVIYLRVILEAEEVS